MKKNLCKYYRTIYKSIPCSNAIKRQLTEQLRHSVEEYLLKNPSANFSAIVTHFGTPEQIVSAYVAELDPTEIVQTINIKKLILKIVCFVMLFCMLAWGTVLIIASIDAKDSAAGHIEIEEAIKIE